MLDQVLFTLKHCGLEQKVFFCYAIITGKLVQWHTRYLPGKKLLHLKQSSLKVSLMININACFKCSEHIECMFALVHQVS